MDAVRATGLRELDADRPGYYGASRSDEPAA
jgi:hypothetical protein